ncbi:hypothetical protein VPH35_136110 [Triticum aestivum]
MMLAVLCYCEHGAAWLVDVVRAICVSTWVPLTRGLFCSLTVASVDWSRVSNCQSPVEFIVGPDHRSIEHAAFRLKAERNMLCDIRVGLISGSSERSMDQMKISYELEIKLSWK